MAVSDTILPLHGGQEIANMNALVRKNGVTQVMMMIKPCNLENYNYLATKYWLDLL